MKTQRIECVTPEAVRAHLQSMAESLNTKTKRGSMAGGVARLAVQIGDTGSSISATIRGVQLPSTRVLAYLGLRKAEVYVRDQKPQGK